MRKLQDQKLLIGGSAESVPCELLRWMLVVVDVWLRSWWSYPRTVTEGSGGDVVGAIGAVGKRVGVRGKGREGGGEER